MKGYPRGFLASLVSTLTLLFLSGALLSPTTLVFQLEWAMPWRASGAVRLWTTATHALAGFLIVGFLGALWALHMRQGWKRKQNYRSGSSLTIVFVLLLITGVGIYYLGSETGTYLAALSHLALGWLLPGLFFLHWIRGRRVRRRNRINNSSQRTPDRARG